jgi:hypothetical protein
VIETSSFQGTRQSSCHSFASFYLKTEAEPASETLFFKEKSLDDGYIPKARFFEIHRQNLSE